jgi:PTS system nitrogen regulatory IIA component
MWPEICSVQDRIDPIKDPIMPLTDVLQPEAIIPALKAGSKKQALQELSEHAARLSGLSEREIFDALLQRERLGSTGIGKGIAIPHGKMAKVDRLIGVFARLEKPIDFESLDGEPVDLIFLLLAPETAGADHLKALSRVARTMRDPAIAQKLRMTKEASALYALLTQNPTASAA